MLLVLAGLPEPEVDLKIVDEHGQIVLRADLAYRGVKLAIIDGRHHLEDRVQVARDGDRRDEFEEGLWRLLVGGELGHLPRAPEDHQPRLASPARPRVQRPARADGRLARPLRPLTAPALTSALRVGRWVRSCDRVFAHKSPH